jgi:putative oxidoreductase
MTLIKEKTMTITRPRTDLALLVLRLVAGGIMIPHGAQKLFVFGFAGVSGGFAQMGVPMPGVMGPFIALLEFFGGIAVVFGLLTRLAALGLAFDMLGAILLVHMKNGFFNPTGFEFPLMLAGAFVTLVIAGGGAYSLDSALSNRRTAA